jgi:hypothetical protein
MLTLGQWACVGGMCAPLPSKALPLDPVMAAVGVVPCVAVARVVSATVPCTTMGDGRVVSPPYGRVVSPSLVPWGVVPSFIPSSMSFSIGIGMWIVLAVPTALPPCTPPPMNAPMEVMLSPAVLVATAAMAFSPAYTLLLPVAVPTVASVASAVAVVDRHWLHLQWESLQWEDLFSFGCICCNCCNGRISMVAICRNANGCVGRIGIGRCRRWISISSNGRACCICCNGNCCNVAGLFASSVLATVLPVLPIALPTNRVAGVNRRVGVDRVAPEEHRFAPCALDGAFERDEDKHLV